MTTNDADVLALANLPNADGRPLPRRCYTDLFCPAETAIKDAMWAVERMAGSPGLTDALNLLEQAKKRVADYVDGVEGERDKLLGDARFYAKKMREDSADGKTVRVPLSVARVLEDCARALSRPVPEGWRPFNVNNYARVKLTAVGRKAHADWYLEIGINPPVLKVDENGRVKMQLWEVMQFFGSRMGNGQPVPFETEMEIEFPAAPSEREDR